MRTKHLCVLIHIRTKGEVGTVKHVIFMLTVPRWCFFCGYFPRQNINIPLRIIFFASHAMMILYDL